MLLLHRLEIRVDEYTRDRLQEISQETGKSQAEIVRDAVAKVIENLPSASKSKALRT
jgi:predicted DNA-binding protein